MKQQRRHVVFGDQLKGDLKETDFRRKKKSSSTGQDVVSRELAQGKWGGREEMERSKGESVAKRRSS